MFCLLLLGVVVLTGGCGAQNMTENGTITITVESTGLIMLLEFCSLEGGLSATAAYDFVANISVESFQRLCVDAAEHQQAWDCFENITNAVNSNTTDFLYFPMFVQVLSAMGVLCSDPRIIPECIIQYSEQYEELGSCMAPHKATIDAVTTEGNLRMCLEIYVTFKCARDVISKCDVYTGNVMGDHLQLSVPPRCAFYSTIVG